MIALQLLRGDQRHHPAGHPRRRLIDLTSERLRRRVIGAMGGARDARPSPPTRSPSLRGTRPAPPSARRRGTARAALAGALLFLAWLGRRAVLVRHHARPPLRGLSGLGVILRLMVPPSPGEQWLDILRGLAESVAMAFLGTFVAALVAVPLGFLGAAQRGGERAARTSRCAACSTGSAAWTSSSGRWPSCARSASARSPACWRSPPPTSPCWPSSTPRRSRTPSSARSRACVAAGGRAPGAAALRPAAAGAAGACWRRRCISSRATPAPPPSSAWSAPAASACRSPSASASAHWDEVAFIILLMIATVAVIDWLSGRLRRRLIGGRAG